MSRARPGLIGCDLDGTLVSWTGTADEPSSSDQYEVGTSTGVRPRVAEAVAATIAAGIPVVAVTGRPWQWTLDLARAHRLLPTAVVSNGAALLDVATGGVSSNGLADGAVVGLMSRIRAAVPGVTFALDRTDDLYHEPGFHDATYLGQHEAEDLVPLAGRDVVKLIARNAGMPGRELAALLHHEVLDGVAVPHAGMGEWVELLASGVSKASGLAVVAAALGVDRADVWAVGDAWNDMPMFEWAGHAVAMADASTVVRSAADQVVPTAADDGVAVLLEELLAGV